MQTQLIEINAVTPFDKNPRINEHAVDKVAASIEKFGFNQPIVTNTEGVICVGHTRWLAAKQLGLKKIPVFKKEMSELEFIAYNVADNRTGEDAKWNEEILSSLLKELNALDDTLLNLTGFDEEELGDLLNDFDEGFNPWDSNDKAKSKGENLDGITAFIKISCDQEDRDDLIEALKPVVAKYVGASFE